MCINKQQNFILKPASYQSSHITLKTTRINTERKSANFRSSFRHTKTRNASDPLNEIYLDIETKRKNELKAGNTIINIIYIISSGYFKHEGVKKIVFFTWHLHNTIWGKSMWKILDLYFSLNWHWGVMR